MGQIVIIIAGRDPTLQPGGSESYARAIGRAALLAGYEPHLFCVGTNTRTETTPFAFQLQLLRFTQRRGGGRPRSRTP
jgi:hypothetical protein